jgi:hypothetical protein
MQRLLGSLSNQPCIPVQADEDASTGRCGHVHIAKPSNCFFGLGGARSEAADGKLVLVDNCKNPNVLRALGVRTEPDVADWIALTTELGISTAGNPGLLPNEEWVVQAISQVARLLLNGKECGSNTSDLYMVCTDHTMSETYLVKAQEAVSGNDRPALVTRCSGLHKYGLHLLAPSALTKQDIAVLCQHLKLNTLGSVVKEEVVAEGEPGGTTDTMGDYALANGSQAEGGAFEAILRSQVFADGLLALLRMAQPDLNVEQVFSQLRELFTSLQIRWAPKLMTHLLHKPSGDVLQGSAAQVDLFCTGDDNDGTGQVLWCSRAVFVADPQRFIKTAAAQIRPLLSHVDLPALPNELQIVHMMECSNPGEIPMVLYGLGIDTIRVADLNHRTLGSEIDPLTDRYIHEPMNVTFKVGEIVALRQEAESEGVMGRFLYAKVRELEADDRTQDTWLQRQYRVQVSMDEDATRLVLHLELFKIQRTAPTPSPARTGSEMVPKSSGGSMCAYKTLV